MLIFKPSDKHKDQGYHTSKNCTDGQHDCCSPQPKGKIPCPRCGEKAKGVLAKTLDHLLIPETKNRLEVLEGFHYCKTPSCDVVYFRGDTLLTQCDITVTVGCKEDASPATVCYCFGWTEEKIKAQLEATGKTTALEDIRAKMQAPGCSCEILNPGGGCCLGDVTKAIKQLETK